MRGDRGGGGPKPHKCQKLFYLEMRFAGNGSLKCLKITVGAGIVVGGCLLLGRPALEFVLTYVGLWLERAQLVLSLL
jgi:hypothetical protein